MKTIREVMKHKNGPEITMKPDEVEEYFPSMCQSPNTKAELVRLAESGKIHLFPYGSDYAVRIG